MQGIDRVSVRKRGINIGPMEARFRQIAEMIPPETLGVGLTEFGEGTDPEYEHIKKLLWSEVNRVSRGFPTHNRDGRSPEFIWLYEWIFTVKKRVAERRAALNN